MKIYFARPITQYNTDQDSKDLIQLQKMGYEVVDPNTSELQEKYKKEGMSCFLQLISKCDGLAFRAFYYGQIGAGVYKEIVKAHELGLFIFELPNRLSLRHISVKATRAYIKHLLN